MAYIHKTEKIILPANSTTPVLVARVNTANMQSLMLQVTGDDAKVLGSNGRDFANGYLFAVGQQRIYSSADFSRSAGGEPFEIWMCAAGSIDVIVLVESIIWSG